MANKQPRFLRFYSLFKASINSNLAKNPLPENNDYGNPYSRYKTIVYTNNTNTKVKFVAGTLFSIGSNLQNQLIPISAQARRAAKLPLPQPSSYRFTDENLNRITQVLKNLAKDINKQ